MKVQGTASIKWIHLSAAQRRGRSGLMAADNALKDSERRPRGRERKQGSPFISVGPCGWFICSCSATGAIWP